MSFTPTRILVTGGAGFIGSALCRRLINLPGVRVLALDKLAPHAAGAAALPGEGDCFRLIRGDILDEPLVADVIADFQPDAVAHLAAESHVDVSIETPGLFVQNNILGTFSVLQASLKLWESLRGEARDKFRFLYMSTDEVFGVAGDKAFDVHSPFAPRSPYSASKAAGDHLTAAWGHTYGLPVVIANSANAYGPFQHPEKLIPLMIIRALQRESLPVYGDGQQVRDWLHVDDLAEGVVAALSRGEPGGRYLFSAREPRTNRAVVEMICDLVDLAASDGNAPRRTLMEFVSDRPGHDRRYEVNPESAEQGLSWMAQTRFDRGLALAVKWYVERRDWWGPRADANATRRRGLRAIAE